MEILSHTLLVFSFALLYHAGNAQYGQYQYGQTDDLNQMLYDSMQDLPSEIVDSICDIICPDDEEEEETGGCCSGNESGSHELVCLRDWWLEAGCSTNGLAAPDNAPENVEWWNERTVAEVKADMALYVEYAAEGREDYYDKCYGESDTASCSVKRPGPHTLACLRSWWIEVGCSSDGPSAPDNAPENVEWWNERTTEEVQADMALYPEYANDGQQYYYDTCYGTINPSGCYDDSGPAPHSMACLIQWWASVGCSLDGTHSPIYKPDLYWWQQRSAEDVLTDMRLFKEYADDEYLDYVTKCYGN